RRDGEVRRPVAAAADPRFLAARCRSTPPGAACASSRRTRQRAAESRRGRAAELLGGSAATPRLRPPDHGRERREVLRARAAHARPAAARRARLDSRLRARAAPRTTPGIRGGTAMKWNLVQKHEDVIYEKSGSGIAKITINRPEVRNAFRPQTLFELQKCFEDVREDPDTGVAILTGAGDQAFCSGGDQRIRGAEGYVGSDGVPRLNVLDLQKQIRSLPKPVIAMVAGHAIGGGHVLHVVCDLSIAADNARFGQTGPRVGSFDGGFGSSTLASIVGLKKA